MSRQQKMRQGIVTRTSPDGEPRYQVRFSRGRDPITGKRLYSFKTFTSRKDAQQWRTAQQRALDTGMFVEQARVPLGEFLTEWMDGTARLTVRSRTLEDYRGLVRRYIEGHPVAYLELGKLTTIALEHFYAELHDRPLSARTVRMVHTVIHRALAKAVKARILLTNPAAGAALPRQQQREMLALNREQAARFLIASETADPRMHALWHVLIHGGLRPSEALALTWADVTDTGIVVRRTLTMKRNGIGGTLEEPKTPGSRRAVTLPPASLAALAWHRTRQEAEKLTEGNRYRDQGLVFASEIGTPLNLTNITQRHFKPLLRLLNLPTIRLYDLRHTHASLMLAAGVAVHVVSARLGHASAKMTLDVYAHVLSGQQEDAVMKLRAYMAVE